MKQVPFQIREQIVPASANAFTSVEMLNNYLNKDKRKGLVIKAIDIELETDIEYADGDEWFVQIVTQEYAAEGFLDDKDVKYKIKKQFKFTTSGLAYHHQVHHEWCGKKVIIPTQKFWVQTQTVGQSAAITVNIVLHCVMAFINETTWNRITSPD